MLFGGETIFFGDFGLHEVYQHTANAQAFADGRLAAISLQMARFRLEDDLRDTGKRRYRFGLRVLQTPFAESRRYFGTIRRLNLPGPGNIFEESHA